VLNQIKLYGEIGSEVKAVDVKMQIDAMDKTQPLVVRIHSEGGSVIDGLAIYDEFKTYPGPKKAIVESAAFSIASFIAMAFDEVDITENGYFMIHNPWAKTEGDDQDHADSLNLLSKLKEKMVGAYSEKTGKSRDEVLSIMKAETWVDAKEAVNQGYANGIIQAKPVAVKAMIKNMPQGVLRSLSGDRSDAGNERETTQEKTMSTTQPVAASLAEIRAALPKAKPDFILKCLERNLPMASVMSEAAATLEEECMSLRAELEKMKSAKAMEEETAAKAKAQEEEQMKAKAMEEEEMAKAKARSGVKPIAKGSSGVTGSATASAKWKAALQSKIDSGIPRAKAIFAIEVEHPGLRQQMVEEANSAR
jgi:ATP-dependent protease ClpP protease subunit